MTTKKKIVLSLLCVLGVALLVLVLLNHGPEKEESPYQIIDRVEKALGDDGKKRTVTEVFDVQYQCEGGSVIVYYLCFTTYYEADPTEVTGLDTNTIQAVFDPDLAESTRICQVNDFPAALYQKGERSYLCWTLSPQMSCVLEYDPTAVSDADMFRMAESIPFNPGK